MIMDEYKEKIINKIKNKIKGNQRNGDQI